MLKFDIRGLRVGASHVKKLGMCVSARTLAEVMQCSHEYVGAALTLFPYLQKELGVRFFRADMRYVYLVASEELKCRGEPVTCAALAEEVDFLERRVRSFLRRNVDFGKEIGLLGDGTVRGEEAAVAQLRCEALAKKLGRSFSRRDFRQEYNISRSLLANQIKRFPTIRNYFSESIASAA